jgi:hypothetical protein
LHDGCLALDGADEIALVKTIQRVIGSQRRKILRKRQQTCHGSTLAGLFGDVDFWHDRRRLRFDNGLRIRCRHFDETLRLSLGYRLRLRLGLGLDDRWRWRRRRLFEDQARETLGNFLSCRVSVRNREYREHQADDE